MPDTLAILEDAAKGAAAGSVVPGFGTALGAAGAVVLDLAPDLSRWLFGDTTGQTVAKVSTALRTVTGTPDPSAQVAVLEDPAKASALRVQLASIAAEAAAAERTAQSEELAARLADVADARKQTTSLASAGSTIAWGAPIVSIAVLLGYGYAEWAVFHAGPETTAGQTGIIELTKLLAVAVVGYWVGSSAGSARKTDLLAQQSTQLANSVPVK